MRQSKTKTTSALNSTGGFFITGTDTDVGKTYAGACLAHTLIEQGKIVIPRKPIASGCIRQADDSLLSEDAEFLKLGSQSTESLSIICPYQFEPAISPQTAIEQAGLVINTEQLESAIKPKKPLEDNEVLMVEGAGGFLSPLCSDGLNRDLAVRLQLPVVLVVKNQLGCINHTLLTIEAIRHSGLEIHSIVLNYADLEDYASDLEKWTDIPIYKLHFQPNKSLQLLDNFIC